jgi:SAM-dependent methyltransferase
MVASHEAYFQYLKGRSRAAWLYRRFLLYPILCRHLQGSAVDIGCGVGDMLSYRPNTVGVDLNPLTVEHCRRRGLDAVLMEADVLPFSDGRFASAVLDNVLEHIARPEKLLDETRRVLAPGGVLIVGVPGERGYGSDPDHKIYYDERTLTIAVESRGFRRDRILHIPFRARVLSRRLRQYCLYGVFVRV